MCVGSKCKKKLKDATLSGKQVKINKNRFYFLMCETAAPLPYFYVCTCVCIQFPQQTTKRKLFYPAITGTGVYEVTSTYWNILTFRSLIHNFSHFYDGAYVNKKNIFSA